MAVIDVAGHHWGADVRAAYSSAGIVTSGVPGGCTGYCQPMDASVIKVWKSEFRKLKTEYYAEQAGRRVGAKGHMKTPTR